jgi:pimeloyl-ACP methyl ester carboxylesterase
LTSPTSDARRLPAGPAAFRCTIRGIDASRRAAIEAQFLALRPEQFQQMYDSPVVFVEQVDFESLYDLSRIAAETLIVNGDQDPLIDAAQTPDIAARFPAAEWLVESGSVIFCTSSAHPYLMSTSTF